MEEKMKYHITITDNETGEVKTDTDACAIIGGIGVEDGAISFGHTDCNTFELAVALQAAEAAVEQLYGDDPALRLLVMAHKKLEEQKQRETDNN